MIHEKAAWVLGFLVLCVPACAGETKTDPESAHDVATGTRPDEQSRCDFRGRDDRDVSESSAPGSVAPNVRRVFGYVGTGEDRRRVLLCREVDTNLDGIKDVVRTYDDDGTKLTEQADADFDGRIDTWISFVDGKPHKVELDKNGDGVVEETKFYTDGTITRAERDTNKDKKADVFEVYEDGDLVRMGVDVDHDGQVDRWDRDEIRLRKKAEGETEEESESSQGGDETKADDDAG